MSKASANKQMRRHLQSDYNKEVARMNANGQNKINEIKANLNMEYAERLKTGSLQAVKEYKKSIIDLPTMERILFGLRVIFKEIE